MGEGATEFELLESYPHLTSEDIKAAILYAADTLAHEETVQGRTISHAFGFRPGIELDKLNQLVDELEAEEGGAAARKLGDSIIRK